MFATGQSTTSATSTTFCTSIALSVVRNRNGPTMTCLKRKGKHNMEGMILTPTAMGSTPEKRNDCWGTPQKLFDWLGTVFDFKLDVCADDKNHKCAVYFTEAQDALKQIWPAGMVCKRLGKNREGGLRSSASCRLPRKQPGTDSLSVELSAMPKTYGTSLGPTTEVRSG